MNFLFGKGNNTTNNTKIIPNCNRLVLCDSDSFPLKQMKTVSEINNQSWIPNHKFCEAISFSQGGPWAIAVGCNPAKGSKNYFDETNKRVAQYIFGTGNYGGYYLFNLYTVMTSSIKLLKRYNRKNTDSINDFQNDLAQILLNCKNDVFIFWGPDAKALLNPSTSQSVRALFKKRKRLHIEMFFSVDSNNSFIHPCKDDFQMFLQITNEKQLDSII